MRDVNPLSPALYSSERLFTASGSVSCTSNLAESGAYDISQFSTFKTHRLTDSLSYPPVAAPVEHLTEAVEVGCDLHSGYAMRGSYKNIKS